MGKSSKKKGGSSGRENDTSIAKKKTKAPEADKSFDDVDSFESINVFLTELVRRPNVLDHIWQVTAIDVFVYIKQKEPLDVLEIALAGLDALTSEKGPVEWLSGTLVENKVSVDRNDTHKNLEKLLFVSATKGDPDLPVGAPSGPCLGASGAGGEALMLQTSSSMVNQKNRRAHIWDLLADKSDYDYSFADSKSGNGSKKGLIKGPSIPSSGSIEFLSKLEGITDSPIEDSEAPQTSSLTFMSGYELKKKSRREKLINFCVLKNHVFRILVNEAFTASLQKRLVLEIAKLKKRNRTNFSVIPKKVEHELYMEGKMLILFIDTLTYPKPCRSFKMVVDPNTKLKSIRALVQRECAVGLTDIGELSMRFLGKELKVEKDEMTLTELRFKPFQKIVITKIPSKTDAVSEFTGEDVAAATGKRLLDETDQNRRFVGSLLMGDDSRSADGENVNSAKLRDPAMQRSWISHGFQVLGQAIEEMTVQKMLDAYHDDQKKKQSEIELLALIDLEDDRESKKDKSSASKKSKNSNTTSKAKKALENVATSVPQDMNRNDNQNEDKDDDDDDDDDSDGDGDNDGDNDGDKVKKMNVTLAKPFVETLGDMTIADVGNMEIAKNKRRLKADKQRELQQKSEEERLRKINAENAARHAARVAEQERINQLNQKMQREAEEAAKAALDAKQKAEAEKEKPATKLTLKEKKKRKKVQKEQKQEQGPFQPSEQLLMIPGDSNSTHFSQNDVIAPPPLAVPAVAPVVTPNLHFHTPPGLALNEPTHSLAVGSTAASSSLSKFCTDCGSKFNSQNDKFCGNCGRSRVPSASQPVSATSADGTNGANNTIPPTTITSAAAAVVGGPSQVDTSITAQNNHDLNPFTSSLYGSLSLTGLLPSNEPSVLPITDMSHVRSNGQSSSTGTFGGIQSGLDTSLQRSEIARVSDLASLEVPVPGLWGATTEASTATTSTAGIFNISQEIRGFIGDTKSSDSPTAGNPQSLLGNLGLDSQPGPGSMFSMGNGESEGQRRINQILASKMQKKK